MLIFKSLENEKIGKVRLLISEYDNTIWFFTSDIIHLISKKEDLGSFADINEKDIILFCIHDFHVTPFVKDTAAYDYCSSEFSKELKEIANSVILNHRKISKDFFSFKEIINLVKEYYNKDMTISDVIHFSNIEEIDTSFNKHDKQTSGFIEHNANKLLLSIGISIEFDLYDDIINTEVV